ncbi:MAG TPA: 3-phosphoshikimate 1-carboxyvinyltransferase [Actinomycetota bacterium]|nr:3-phosphoshikimate 1-carboxyvinyltransferase [Actinomycetota bacterium]
MSIRRRWRTSPASAPLRGTLEVPGDKSITHRALMISSLALGRSLVTNANLGEDCRATAAILELLGAATSVDEPNYQVEVKGRGMGGLVEPGRILDAGNSGTTARTILGLCAGVEGLSVVTGDASLLRRPMLRVVAPLRQMGARIDGRHFGDRAPLVIRGSDLSGVDLELQVASAQVKTAVLLAGLHASGPTSLIEPGPSRDHTERMLAAAGAELRVESNRVELEPTHVLSAMTWDVPGDISSAAFLLVAAAIVVGSELTITNLGLNPSRAGLLDVMSRMGAEIEVKVSGERFGEPFGDVSVRGSDLTGTTIEGAEIPTLIDELPVVAVLASCAEGETLIRNAQELRVKESDRIDVMCAGLRELGVDCSPQPDGMRIQGPSVFKGAEVDSHGDHRAAMAFAVAGLRSEEPVVVKGWSSVSTSFPEFLDLLGRAQGRYG